MRLPCVHGKRRSCPLWSFLLSAPHPCFCVFLFVVRFYLWGLMEWSHDSGSHRLVIASHVNPVASASLPMLERGSVHEHVVELLAVL